MTQVAELRYVALKPLLLQTEEGERLRLTPGEEIPSVVHGRWIDLAIESGKVAPLSYLEDHSDAELRQELESRGYKVTKAAK